MIVLRKGVLARTICDSERPKQGKLSGCGQSLYQLRVRSEPRRSCCRVLAVECQCGAPSWQASLWPLAGCVLSAEAGAPPHPILA